MTGITVSIFLILLGICIVFMPYVAIWKIWKGLERVEKINEGIFAALTTILAIKAEEKLEESKETP